MKAVIVDDEPLARAHLRRLLEMQGVEISGEAENATEALRLAEDLRPDLLLLDIQMPGLSGMQLASALMSLEAPPILVFVTGYSEYALAAFEHNALDYLVKPVASDRLAKTLAKVRDRLSDKQARHAAAARILDQEVEKPLRRIPVREDYAVRLIRVEDIYCAVARNKRVFLHTETAEFRTYYTLSNLETLLPSDRFLRIHDSAVVDLERVEEILFLGNHSYRVRLSNDLQLPIARTRYPELQRRLGLTPETDE